MSDKAAARLQDWDAEIGIVLGSGLSGLVDDVPTSQVVNYTEFTGLPKPGVPGHQGSFVLSKINDTRVIYAQGRAHVYEGHTARAVTAIVRVLASSGVRRLILTNAAGSANPAFEPGCWMMLSDHLNLTGTTPLMAAPQFVDMTDAYSAGWRRDFAAAAEQLQMTLYEGIYAGVLGPQYETPAEVRMIRHFGADAIGMSTVLETIQARALGLEVAAFSCLTNWAVGVGAEHLTHDHVLATGKAASAQFARLLKRVL